MTVSHPWSKCVSRIQTTDTYKYLEEEEKKGIILYEEYINQYQRWKILGETLTPGQARGVDYYGVDIGEKVSWNKR